MADEEYEASDERIHQWLKGFLEGMTGTNHKLIPLIEQLCRDLNEAHNELLRQQGVPEADWGKFDWPEWTNQANSIRWAERATKTRLAKTDQWTLYPATTIDDQPNAGKQGSIH